LAQIVDAQFSTLETVASRLLGTTLTSVERVSGGRNSQIFKVNCGGNDHYAFKHYFRHPADGRDRLGVEFSSLKFLWRNGVRSIPKPVAADGQRQWAVYEWIEGEDIPGEQVTDSDIDDAVEFLGKLHELAGSEASTHLPAASEACYSAQATIDNVRMRLNRLRSCENVEGQAEGLPGFLADEFEPLFNEVAEWCRERYARSGQSYLSELHLPDRTLSPSDFGFHNALRRSDGQIVFLDFEYFGWDDPAKTISDFLLHPAMDLKEGLKQQFVSGVLTRFKGSGDLAMRVTALYPLFGLKWCLILLNEFLPEHLLRRDFARVRSGNQDSLQAAQLVKARRMLARVCEQYEQFPYQS